MKLSKNTYIIKLECPLENETALLIDLTPFEHPLLKYIETLSNKLAKDGSQPRLSVTPFPYKEYYGRKLSNHERDEINAIIKENRNAYKRIRNELKKQAKATPNNNKELE